ncbi:MAG TPA: tripartite tricarboxylate transporter TctB family protein [Kiloniellaceae bacterium]
MFRADRGDLLAGLIIAAVGGWFLVGAFDYRIGTAVRMGPGYLPMVFGIITLVLGLAIMLLALGRDGKLPLPAPRACLAVLVSIAGFTLVLPRAGLIPAALVAVMIATRGDRDARLTSSLVLAVCVAVVSWIVFVEFLGMPMPAFRMPAL